MCVYILLRLACARLVRQSFRRILIMHMWASVCAVHVCECVVYTQTASPIATCGVVVWQRRLSWMLLHSTIIHTHTASLSECVRMLRVLRIPLHIVRITLSFPNAAGINARVIYI